MKPTKFDFDNIRVMSINIEPTKEYMHKDYNFEKVLQEASLLSLQTDTEVKVDMGDNAMIVNISHKYKGGSPRPGVDKQIYNTIDPDEVQVKKVVGGVEVYFPIHNHENLFIEIEIADNVLELNDFLYEKGFKGKTAGQILHLINNLLK